MKLVNLLKEGLGPDNAMIDKISDALKKELGVSNVKAEKYSQGRARVGYTFYPGNSENGLYVDEAYDGIWEVYTVDGRGNVKSNYWEISSLPDELEDSAAALKAALAVIKKFKKDFSK